MAIIITDYYFIKKRDYDISNLAKRDGAYWYTGGFNIAAIIAWVGGTAAFVILKNIGFGANHVGAVLPSFGLCMVIYYLAAKIMYGNQMGSEKEM